MPWRRSSRVYASVVAHESVSRPYVYSETPPSKAQKKPSDYASDHSTESENYGPSRASRALQRSLASASAEGVIVRRNSTIKELGRKQDANLQSSLMSAGSPSRQSAAGRTKHRRPEMQTNAQYPTNLREMRHSAKPASETSKKFTEPATFSNSVAKKTQNPAEESHGGDGVEDALCCSKKKKSKADQLRELNPFGGLCEM